MLRSPVDRFGKPVAVGARVRILNVAPELEDRLSVEEWEQLQTMVGDIFTVYEIDEFGSPWVEKWFGSEEDGRSCHSLALAPEEMEVVSSASGVSANDDAGS